LLSIRNQNRAARAVPFFGVFSVLISASYQESFSFHHLTDRPNDLFSVFSVHFVTAPALKPPLYLIPSAATPFRAPRRTRTPSFVSFRISRRPAAPSPDWSPVRSPAEGRRDEIGRLSTSGREWRVLHRKPG
jgi:hypothetical protein